MTPSTPVVITVSPRDVTGKDLFGLLSAEYAYMRGRIDPESSLLAMTAADIENKQQTEILIVARVSRHLIGCLFCRPEMLWLYVGKLAVATAHRHRGLAKAMIDEAVGVAAKLGLTGLELETRIELVENQQAFAKMGFEIVEESAHPGYDRPTKVRMQRIELSRCSQPWV